MAQRAADHPGLGDEHGFEIAGRERELAHRSRSIAEYRAGSSVVGRMRLATASVLAASVFLGGAGAAHAAWLAPHDANVGPLSRASGAAIAPDGTVTSIFADGAGQPAVAQGRRSSRPGAVPRAGAAVLGRARRASRSRASDRLGNVVVVWDEQLNGTSVVRGATKPAGGEFTPAQSISDTGSGARWPRVAIGGGKAVVAWAQGGRVRAASATAGGPFTVHDPLSGRSASTIRPRWRSRRTERRWSRSGRPASETARPTCTRPHARRRARSRPAGHRQRPGDERRKRAGGDERVRARDGRLVRDSDGVKSVVQTAARGLSGKFGGVETLPVAPTEFTLAVSDDDTALFA